MFPITNHSLSKDNSESALLLTKPRALRAHNRRRDNLHFACGVKSGYLSDASSVLGPRCRGVWCVILPRVPDIPTARECKKPSPRPCGYRRDNSVGNREKNSPRRKTLKCNFGLPINLSTGASISVSTVVWKRTRRLGERSAHWLTQTID